MEAFNPLEKIIFKKGVFEDLANFLAKFNKILIITSKSPKNLYGKALSGFLNEKNITFSFCETTNSNDNEEILKCTARANECDCVVSFGAGKLTDISKIVAKNLNIPLIVVPSTISHFGYFSNFAYINNGITTEKISCKYPDKIFIDENIIRKSPENFVFSAVCFIFSFLETYFSTLAEKEIFASDKTYEVNSIKRIVNKTSGLLNWLCLDKELYSLNLMDNIIELYSTVSSLTCDFPALMLATINFKDNLNNNFGRRCLTNANALLNIYKFFWSDKNLSYKNIPDCEKFIKILQKNQKNSTFFENFVEKFQNTTTPQFFFKVKSLRQNLLLTIILECEKMSKLSKRVMSTFAKNEQRILSESEFYSDLGYVALTSNCFQLNTILRLGYLNIV